MRPVSTVEFRGQRVGGRLRPLGFTYVGPQTLSGLEFSLKPPRWVRKLTIKKALKPLAIAAVVAGSMFIPGVAPVALAIGKGALTAGGAIIRGVGRGATSVFRTILPHSTTAPTTDQIAQSLLTSGGASPAPSAAEQAAAAAQQAAADYAASVLAHNTGPAGGGAPSMPDMNLPSPGAAASYGGGGGGAPMGQPAPSGGDTSAAPSDAVGPPEPKKAFPILPLVLIGGAVLMMSKPKRGR
jgi:hypothetical protein